MHEFKLYVVGRKGKALSAIRTTESLFQEKFRDRYTLEVIDLLERPASSARDKVFATPTLIKAKPEPETRIIGDLMDGQRVSELLQIPY